MKKNVPIICAGAFIIIAVIAMLIFVFSGDNITNDSLIDLQGTWRIASSTDAGLTFANDNEFAVFTDKNVDIYKNNLSTPVSSGAYTVNGDRVRINDLGKEYEMNIATDNVIHLYYTNDTHFSLVRHANSDMTPVEVDKTIFSGKFTVLCHGGSAVTDEYIVFSENTMELYKNGSDTPATVSSYTWTENDKFSATELNMVMTPYIISDNSICFVEEETGYVWELKKAE